MENEISTTALKQIFKYLTCHQVAQSRLVCTKFNIVGKKVLNEKFAKICKDLTILVKNTLKSHLPPKNKNAMTRQQVILLTNSILLMLRAVFGRYITSSRSCFYPGLIIDYANKVTHKLKSNRPGGNFERITLKRLYTCANRAMNHFELYIEPDLDGPLTFNGTKILDYVSTSCHLQAVETERSSFFTKVCNMFPQGRPSTHKYRDNWLFKARNEILIHNNLWVSEHLTSRYESLQQEVDNHSGNESKHTMEGKINNAVKSTNAENNQAPSKIRKPYEKKPLSKYGIPSKVMMMKNLHYTIHNDQETSTSTEARKSSVLDTSLEKVLAPPDFIMSSHQQQNEDLIRTMVNSKQLIEDTHKEQFQVNKRHVYELRSNKQRELIDQPYLYKKYYNFEPYLSNNNYTREDEHPNNQNKETQLYKQNGFLDDLSHFYQNHDLKLHSYKKQYKQFTVEDTQLDKKLCSNRTTSQTENNMFQYKKHYNRTHEYNSNTIPTITIDD